MDHLQTAWIQHLGSSPCAQRLVERAHLLITRHHQLQQFAKTHVLSVKEGNRTLRASASHHAIVVNDTAHVFVPEFPPKHMNKILADLDMVQVGLSEFRLHKRLIGFFYSPATTKSTGLCVILTLVIAS
jgi:hypothetical protein